MFCKKPLGSNDVVEAFPVGRRLAFDPAKGRLWVVCRSCERWNLPPLEERWEAVEDCERTFRDTRLRVSTENIGLARHPEGLTLVRVGRPLRPEFAAWRYGDQFGRRRRKAMFHIAVGATALGTLGALGSLAAGISVVGIVNLPLQLWNLWRNRRALIHLNLGDGRSIGLNRQDLSNTQLRLDERGDGLRLRIGKGHSPTTWFEGEDARHMASNVLPAMNPMGGTKKTVRQAVDRIEAAGHPDDFIADIAGADDFKSGTGESGMVSIMPTPTRLALEMALHEEQERRALEGELWLLERAWREAEEIAAISDNLLLPAGTDEFFDRHREGP